MMITLPGLAAEALGSFLADDMKDRFGVSHARLAEIVPFAARLALECIGNSDALYHNVEHTMLVTLAGAMSTAELGISLAEMIRQGKGGSIIYMGSVHSHEKIPTS